MNLYDSEEYPAEIRLSNGNVIHLPYLTVLIRLADELDIAVDRNIQFLYNPDAVEREQDIIAFGKHQAIREVVCDQHAIIARVDFSDSRLGDYLFKDFEKIYSTLRQCVDVVDTRTPFEIRQKDFVVYDYNTGKLAFSGGKILKDS